MARKETVILLAICVLLGGKVYFQWMSTPTKKVLKPAQDDNLQEAFNAIYERLDAIDQRMNDLGEAQAKLKSLKMPKAKKGGKEDEPPKMPRKIFFLSQVKPGDICIFKASEHEESLVGMLGGREVSYSNQHGEIFRFTDSESGMIAFQRSSILASIRAYRGGKFLMQANKKGRIVPKWYGDVCDHKGTIDSPSGEKSAFFLRACSTSIPWLLTDGVREFNLQSLLEDETSLWLEFGTRIGDTLKHLYKLRPNKGPIYSFDSFEGLPETVENTPYREGKYAVSSEVVTLQSGWYTDNLERLGIPDNVKLVRGWFNETVAAFIEEHRDEKIALVHIDSNLYSSAKEVLDALANHIGSGSVVVFNEYSYCRDQDNYVIDHHPKAFFEFLVRTGLSAQILGSTKYSSAWILLDKEDLPTWLRSIKGREDQDTSASGDNGVGYEEESASALGAAVSEDFDDSSAEGPEGEDQDDTEGQGLAMADQDDTSAQIA